MSRETATPPRRDMLDRLLIRVPTLVEWMGAALLRMPPGSALRRRLMSLSIKRGFAAMARSDLELVLQGYEPDAEVWMRGMSGVGIGGCYRGHEGIRTVYREVDEVFEEWSWAIRALVDGGDRVAIRADFVGLGRGSGVQTTMNDAGHEVLRSRRGHLAGVVRGAEWVAEGPRSRWAVGVGDVAGEHEDRTAMFRRLESRRPRWLSGRNRPGGGVAHRYRGSGRGRRHALPRPRRGSLTPIPGQSHRRI
jgi:ketosteroid isomerase-like protein